MAEPIDISGLRFGKLIAVRRTPEKRNNHYVWECRCDCGKTTHTSVSCLTCGNTKSCGCLLASNGDRFRKHGKTNSKAFRAWVSMIGRCLNEKHQAYHDYGGRGIGVCERWIDSFISFFEDMGDPPSKRHSLGRINNDLGYFKENCEWQTQSKQMSNTRSSVIVEIDGKRKCVTEWCRENGVYPPVAFARIYHGWDPATAVSTPSRWKRRPGKE